MALVERSEIFVQAAGRLGLSARQLDRLLEPIEWTLARDPESFPRIDGTQFRVATTLPFPPSIPPYRVVYSVEGNTATLRSIGQISIGGADQAGR